MTDPDDTLVMLAGMTLQAAALGWTAIRPTGHLRWLHGVLQQQWQGETHRLGAEVEMVREWRDVPTSTEDQT